MLFNSYTFVFLFLPATMLAYHLVRTRFGVPATLVFLSFASLLFYAWWEPRHVTLIATSVGFNFLAARAIVRASGALRARMLAFGILANLGVLLWYKLRASALVTMGEVTSASFSTTEQVLLPLAISFVTFQQIAFLVDVHRAKTPCPAFREYCLFIVFFPQLLVGPIVRLHEMLPQYSTPASFRFDAGNLAVGVAIFTIGLFKKVVIADGLAPYSESVYGVAALGYPPTFFEAWPAVIAFAFQIYFDFSAYADMAIGLGRMFNVNLPINFDSPYRARSRFEFWRRWHITLTVFLRVYVYLPLCRNRYLPLPQPLALLLTSLLSGLWHGLGWTFVVWGALHGAAMLASHYWQRIRGRRSGKKPGRWHRLLAITLTFLTTAIFSIFFRSADIDTAMRMLEGISGLNGLALPNRWLMHAELSFPELVRWLAPIGLGFEYLLVFPRLDIFGHLAAVAILIWFAPSTQAIFGHHWTALDPRSGRPRASRPQWFEFRMNPLWAVLIAGLGSWAVLQLGATNRFIYYQF